MGSPVASRPGAARAHRAIAPALAAGAIALGALLAGCANPPSPASQAASAATPVISATPSPAEPAVPLPVLVVGVHECELKRSVTVRRVAPDRASLVLAWLGRDHTLQVVPTHTGALRYEDARAGLIWLVISGKAMLLDSRGGRQLANECRPSIAARG